MVEYFLSQPDPVSPNGELRHGDPRLSWPDDAQMDRGREAGLDRWWNSP